MKKLNLYVLIAINHKLENWTENWIINLKTEKLNHKYLKTAFLREIMVKCFSITCSGNKKMGIYFYRKILAKIILITKILIPSFIYCYCYFLILNVSQNILNACVFLSDSQTAVNLVNDPEEQKFINRTETNALRR